MKARCNAICFLKLGWIGNIINLNLCSFARQLFQFCIWQPSTAFPVLTWNWRLRRAKKGVTGAAAYTAGMLDGCLHSWSAGNPWMSYSFGGVGINGPLSCCVESAFLSWSFFCGGLFDGHRFLLHGKTSLKQTNTKKEYFGSRGRALEKWQARAGLLGRKIMGNVNC